MKKRRNQSTHSSFFPAETGEAKAHISAAQMLKPYEIKIRFHRIKHCTG